MAGLSETVHQALAAWVNGNAMPTAPVSLHLALSAADPTEDESGMDEPTGGYTRQSVTFTASANPGGGTKLTNDDPVVFGPVTGSPWPTITHAAIFDGTDSYMIAFGPLGVQRTAPVGDTISFGVGAFQFVVR